MTRFGIAASAFALWAALTTAAPAQQTIDDSQIPNTLQHLDTPEPARGAQRSGGRYFIDFRSRSAQSYGHTFVVFGRVGEKLTRKNVAGLHPQGDSTFTYLLGHILMVPADTGASDGDLEEQYMTARYRIWLSAQDYREVVAHIRDLQAHSPTWNAATYNCNAFVGTIAHFVGLATPSPWLLPADFVNGIRHMNNDRRFAVLPRQDVRDPRHAMARHVANKR